MKVLDLFSGIGGFSLAFDQCGMETVAFCEIDEDAQEVLERHWPRVEIFTDVSQVSYNKFEFLLQTQDGEILRSVEDKVNIDVICGGFPCQDISVAGKQKGLIDEEGKTTRSGLWVEYKRLIQEIKPRWVVIENVRNLLSNGASTVFKDLCEIGYDAEWEVISARDVGACHLRERLWIVAYPNRELLRYWSKWNSRGWNNFQSSGEAELRYFGEEGRVGPDDSDGVGSETSVESWRLGTKLSELIGPSCKWIAHPADSDDFRFWPAFTTQEEKSKWWAEATAKYRTWWKAQPELRGVYDGVPAKLHESYRRRRIKQLGNSIVPAIAGLHGNRIQFHEMSAEGGL